MTVYVYQTFQIKQENFKEGMKNLHHMKNYRNKHYNHMVELLTPLTGQDHTYALLAKYQGLAEMELQNKKMFDDEKYVELVGNFFLKHIVQGSMSTQFYRVTEEDKSKNEEEDDE
ncbi:hypothetical protein ACFSCZ_13365 [Siminovitchia sediminis]|uniref:Uncharacterized protein n=1 Tax=Siminovitchia sediminis TaxID=1274353 RepID=A0ABW4KNA9_9BACI